MKEDDRTINEIQKRQKRIIIIASATALIFLVIFSLIYISTHTFKMTKLDRKMFQQSYDFLLEQSIMDTYDNEITECKINSINTDIMCVYFKTESRDFDYCDIYFVRSNIDGNTNLIYHTMKSNDDPNTFSDYLNVSISNTSLWYRDQYLKSDNWKHFKISK